MQERGCALITGATGGLGRALAARLERDGWALALAGRDAKRLENAYAEARHPLIAGDAGTPGGAAELLTRCLDHFGQPPDALAHCVGSVLITPLHRTTPEQYRSCMAANLDSAFFTLSAWVSALRDAKRPGAAVLVSSAAARIGTPNHEAVAAAKAGVEGLVRASAATYAPGGIRINAVAPGIMDTPGTSGLVGNPVTRAAAARQYPLPGIGDPADLADLIAWLLSPAAHWVTGQAWSFDGGFSSVRPLVR